MATRTADIELLLETLVDGDHSARCAALRTLCPCRNHVRDVAVWRAVFRQALHGGMRERDQAAHAIGTLTAKAAASRAWRHLLHALKDDLDALMRDPRASRLVLGQMKKRGHAHRGAARQNYRRRRRLLDLSTPEELATWVNAHLGLPPAERVAPTDPGVRRLWGWLVHRVRFQPARATKEHELVAKARRYLPQLFQPERAAA